MKKIIALLLLFPVLANAQKKENVGVQFIHTVPNWNKIVAQAKKENKYIFVDCFTTWCGPCKEMSAEIFPKKKVGDFFNKTFINVAFQLDTTKKDNADIIASRKVAAAMKKYKINAYPTFLIFDTSGTIVHKFAGGGDEDEIIAKAKIGLNKETQYYNLIKQYEAGNRDDVLLKKLCKTADEAEDNLDDYLKTFIETRENLYTKENGKFLIEFMDEAKGVAFNNFYANKEKWITALSKDKVNEVLESKICSTLEIELIFTPPNKINWQKLTEKYTKLFPEYGKAAVAKEAMGWKLRNNDFKGYFKMLDSLFILYPEQMNYSSELDQNASTIFTLSNDQTLLTKALSWSKKSLEQNRDEPAYLDTYSNLLYKLGQFKEAIEIETKVVALVKESEKKSYQETLDKMKAGKPTW
jgi:thiol-disulfide isomerase/thioredoxin